MKKVFYVLVILFSFSIFFAQTNSNISLEQMNDDQIKEFFSKHKSLYENKKADYDRLSVELKNTPRYEKFFKDAAFLLDDYIYSITREEIEKSEKLKVEVEKIDFAPLDSQLEKWLEMIDENRTAFESVKEYYNKIECLLNENRKIISDYDYKVFTGNIEYKNAPRTFELYANAIKTKSYEEIERLVPVIKEINLAPMEKNVNDKIAEMKAYIEEGRSLRENLPFQASEISEKIAYYEKELPLPGTFSPINQQFVSMRKAVETVKDLDKADLNKLRGIKSELDAVKYDYLDNCVDAYKKGIEITKLLGMRISKDEGWSNPKQQRYYVDVEKESLAEEYKLNGALYFSSAKKNTKNDPAPDFTDMSYTDFLVNLGNHSGKEYSFMFNKKRKPVTIKVPEVK